MELKVPSNGTLPPSSSISLPAQSSPTTKLFDHFLTHEMQQASDAGCLFLSSCENCISLLFLIILSRLLLQFKHTGLTSINLNFTRERRVSKKLTKSELIYLSLKYNSNIKHVKDTFPHLRFANLELPMQKVHCPGSKVGKRLEKHQRKE